MRHLLLAIVVLAASTAHAQVAAPADPCAAADTAIGKHDWRAAAAAGEQCERQAHNAKDDGQIARALLDRGIAARSMGAALDGARLLNESATVAARAHLAPVMTRIYKELSNTYNDLGDWPAYLDYANRSFESNPHPDDRARLDLLEVRAWSAMELGDRDTSLRLFDEAVAMSERINDPTLIAMITSEAGLAQWRLARDRGRAMSFYDRALAIARRIGDNGRARTILINSGNIFRSAHEWQEAERRYTEGLALAKKEGRTDVFLLKNIGMVYRDTGRFNEAERAFLAAVSDADRNGIARIAWQARMELGKLYRSSDPARATRYFEECLDKLEGAHSNVLLDDFSAGALAGAITINDDPYDLYIDHLMRLGQAPAALQVAERARARAFLDTLSRSRDVIAAQVPAGFVRRERELLADISTQQASLRSGAGDATALQATIAQDEQQLTALRVRFATDHPEIAHARFPRLLSPADIQRLVAGDTAVIEYFVGADTTTAWLVTSGAIAATRLPARDVIARDVRGYLAALTSPATEFTKARRQATEDIFARIGPLPPQIARLVVVPHGILNYLPFETLEADGQFLIEKYATSYAPSISTLAFLQSRPQRSGGRVVAIGDPVLDGNEAAGQRGLSVDRIDLLKPLANAGRELQSVASAFSSVEVLDKQRATEGFLHSSAIDQAPILHFATHGIIDEDHPDRSGLVLTAAAPDDGLLQMREIYGLHLTGAVVTLSACSTALGRQVSGEGMIGMTRAFMQAGARTVIASLWNIDDRSTADLMARFYTSLSHGAAIDEAARSARLSLLHAGGELAHPYYWGAFVVSGEGRSPIAVATRASIFPWGLGAAAILLLTIAAAIRYRAVAVR